MFSGNYFVKMSKAKTIETSPMTTPSPYSDKITTPTLKPIPITLAVPPPPYFFQFQHEQSQRQEEKSRKERTDKICTVHIEVYFLKIKV